MSASQPVANWERSWRELRVNRVMGFRLGSLTPSIRATCMGSDICFRVQTLGGRGTRTLCSVGAENLG